MIEIVKGDKVIKTPEEITIGMYQKMTNSKTAFDDPVELISIFTGLSIDEIKNQPKKTIKLLNGFIGSKLAIPDEVPLIHTFIHNGIEYGLEKDFGNMSWGAWVDLEVYSNTDTINDNIHKIMSVLYRPIIKTNKDRTKYEIEPYRSESIVARSELFLDLPMTYWFGVSRFFLDIVNAFITSIGTSLSQKKKIQNWIMTGWMKLPKWLKKMIPLDFILN